MTALQPSMRCSKLTGNNQLDRPDVDLTRPLAEANSATSQCLYANRKQVSYRAELEVDVGCEFDTPRLRCYLPPGVQLNDHNMVMM